MLPTVDIGVYEAGGDLRHDDVQQAVRQLHQAISQHGFCYLTGHGVPQHMVEKMFETSRKFFALPDDVKKRYSMDSVSYHGYIGMETEKLNTDRPYGDLKECFNYEPAEGLRMPNDELPEMQTVFRECFSLCHGLALRMVDLLGLALDIKDLEFLRNCYKKIGTKENCTTLRSNYYPPDAKALKEGQLSCSEHSDYETFSFLFQDDVGGLQIQGKDGQYHDVPPVPGTLVLNVGDLMQRWTADKYPSTKHRVVLPESALREGRARQSLAFFCNADNDAVITCLDGSNKYPPITAYQYMSSLMDASRS